MDKIELMTLEKHGRDSDEGVKDLQPQAERYWELSKYYKRLYELERERNRTALKQWYELNTKHQKELQTLAEATDALETRGTGV